MRRLVGVAAAAVVLLFLGGCAVSSLPSYAEVSEQTKGSLQEIVDQLPQGSVATARPEQKPYSCDDAISLNKGEGYFYTGAWDVALPPGTDVAAVVNGLPALLGSGWEEVSSIKLSAPRVELRDTKTGVQVNVMGSTADQTPPSLYLNGISRCGALPAS